ncbi:MAG: bifunctional phosphoglucose/phosphomannose isomerase [Candidatus Zixiibacteriota bacterium]|nr:MAG: bifunctional phosphoglucose/phosphomannose isomerase [candidate division Zixibacteria bacterium]
MVDISLRRFDRQNMYEKIVDFHKQLIDGIDIGYNSDLENLEGAEFRNIILAGMGGSAISGDLIKSFLQCELSIRFDVHRNYGLPLYSGKDSLVICSSYSGNTEETLSAYETALRKSCNVFCITTGGELCRRAKRDGKPVVVIPSGLMPRSALGYSFAPLMVIFGRLGLCRDYSFELEQTAKNLRHWGSRYQFGSSENGAYDLALKLAGKVIVIYSGSSNMGVVGYRFKTQICENAKQLAFCNVFPEFNHNELVGWELSVSHGENMVVVILRDKDDNEQIARRMDIVLKIISEKNVEVIELYTQGDELLTRLFSLIQLADYTSFYMALLNKVDPTPIRVIDYLKERLAEN